MNQKKKQEKSKFSRLRLRSTASTSNKSVSPFVNPREKISSYFSTQINEAENESKSQELFTSGSESQFGQKFSLNEKLENNANDDENDFDETKSLKPPKVFEIKVQKESRPTRKRTRNKNDLSRFVKDVGPSCSDTNQEHLQLALAMSKSLNEFENPGQSQEVSESPFPSTQQKLATLKSTLDQFGFKSDRTAIEIPTVRNNTRQKKKLKFITPTLFLRTEEDRAKLIETKVSGILTNISVYNKFVEDNEAQNNNEEKKFLNNKPNSFLLRDYYDEESTVFRINNLSLSEINESTFYNKTVPKEVVETGILLKNWRSIPGREKTPPLSEGNITVDETEKTQDKDTVPKEVGTGVLLKNWRSIPSGENTPPLSEENITRKDSSLMTDVNMIVEETEISQKNYEEKTAGPNKRPISKVNIIVEETEEIPHINNEERSPEKTKEHGLYNTNTPIDRSISPDLFSDSDSELSIGKSPIEKSPNNLEKSPCNNFTLHISPNSIHSSNRYKERSPIIILSSSNSNKIENTPVLSEKEIFSDDSDSKSLSLLDSISPKRNQSKSPKKNLRNSKSRKSLFIRHESESVSLLAVINDLNKDKDSAKDIFHDSPVKTFENYSQICHYESFHDNSNDCFDLTRSSEESNDIFNANTTLNPINKHFEDIPISQNLFSETVNEIGGHDDNYSAVISKQKEILRPKESEEFIDLTQSSNDAVEKNTKKNKIEYDKNNFEQKYKKHFEETILIYKNKTSSKNNDDTSNIKSNLFEKNKEANNSIQTVLLKKKISAIENIDTISAKTKHLEEEDSDDSVKTVLLIKNNSPKNINNKHIKCNILERNSPKKVPNIPAQNEILDEKNNIENDYSPEFNILDSSNNKDFYNSLSKTSLSVISDSESDNENKSNRNTSKTYLNNISSEIQKTDIVVPKKSLSPNATKSSNENNTPKRETKLLKRSFSENIIDNNEFNFVSQTGDKTDFFKLSSPLSVTNFFTQPCFKSNHKLLTRNHINENVDFHKSLEDIDISDEELNYSVFKSKNYKNKNKNINDISDSDDELNKSKAEIHHKTTRSKKILKNVDEDDVQFSSQSSFGTCSDISDEELNYSTNKSFRVKRLSEVIDDNQENLRDADSFMNFDDLPYTGLEPSRTSLNTNETLNISKRKTEVLKHPRVQDLKTPTKIRSESGLAPNDTFHEILKQTSTPNNNENNVKTPENTKTVPVNITPITPNNDYIIKTSDVTPMPNYNEMSSPQLKKELDKYGIRPLKRAKGIKMLQYIYEATHPILEQSLEKHLKSSSDEEDNRIIKRRKKNTSTINIAQKRLREHESTTVEFIGNEIANCEKEEDMIFERKQSVRIASCRLPLHIAWHNLMSTNQELHEKILLYEPIQVEEIYAKLKSFGYKFHIQDIIAFLDKKCITIRVAQNQKKTAGS